MFNYRNLDDVEFEELCRDIMERKLNVKLRSFRKGVDGGIDLQDNSAENNIIVQVKHYINSKFSDLKSSLKKEIDKVEQLKPNQYYVCCAQELNPQNTNEVYQLFKVYMKTKENIITLKEIDQFLQEDSNKDIVRKHFKLWLCSSNILSEINNQEVFIDCESLLGDIEDESKYYVQTNTYNNCIDSIEKQNVLMITGAPGVGKTTISKMIVLYYANLGYRVRYTTNGVISDLKNVVSSDRNTKEIILLDDCLGQYYFKMNENQECELIALIKYLKNNNNKKLILNSRVTIMNEAKERSTEFEKFTLKNKEKIHMINMDNISIVEKARILYNHIYFNKMPKEYYKYIRKDKNYKTIVSHQNYTPRIIEYITEYERYRYISPEKYVDFVLGYLNNPEGIWRDEYERRLLPVDRMLINILFSITDTTIDYSVLEECFNKRLITENSIDGTINNFKNSINRLNRSMIKIIYKNNRMKISVLNPSVNDYIKNIFLKNSNELENIRKSIVYYEQLERCYSEDDLLVVIKQMVEDNSFKNFKIYNSNVYVNIETLLLYYICELKILNSDYTELIKDYILKLNEETWVDNSMVSKSKIIEGFIEEPLLSFYKIDKHISCFNFMRSILMYIGLKDIYIICNKLTSCVSGDDLKKAGNIIFEETKYKIDEYLENFTIELFVDNIDFWDCFNRHYNFIEDYESTDIAIKETEEEVYEDLLNYIKKVLESSINKIGNVQIKGDIWEFFNYINFEDYTWKNDIVSYVESMLYPDDYEEHSSHEEDNMLSGVYDSTNMDTVDAIFDR